VGRAFPTDQVLHLEHGLAAAIGKPDGYTCSNAGSHGGSDGRANANGGSH
jgi:hypothetical protein